MAVTDHLIYAMFQDFCSPPGTSYEPEAWKSACSLQKEQECKTGIRCVAGHAFTDACPA